MKVPPPIGAIDVTYGPCFSGTQWSASADVSNEGCTYNGTTRIWVKRHGNYPTLFHELGHQVAFGIINTDPAMWKRFLHLIGHSRVDPEEQFAEAYSVCARFATWEDVRGFVDYGVAAWSDRRLDRMCAAIRALH